MKSYWMKSGVLSLFSNGATLGFAFLTFLILVRVMPQVDFGIWVLYLTVTNFADIIRNGITQNGLIKYLEGGKAKDYREIITASFFLNTVTAVISFLVIWAVAGPLARIWDTPVLEPMLLLFGVVLLFQSPLTFLQFLSMANLDFGKRFWSVILYTGSYFALVVIFVLWRGTVQLLELPWLMAAGSALSLVVTVWLNRSYFSLRWPLDRQWVKTLFHFGKYVVGTNFSSVLFNRIDIMMIGFFLNPNLVALYNVPTRVGNYVEVPMNSVALIVFPQVSLRIKEKGMDAARYLWERSIGVLLAMVIPMAILLFIFAEPLVVLIAGEAYRDAAPIMRLFAVLSIIKPFGRQGGIIMDSIGKPNVNFYLLLGSLVINVILNWLFIVHFGIIGAILATMISVLLSTTLSFLTLHHLINVKATHPWVYFIHSYKQAWQRLKFEIQKRRA